MTQEITSIRNLKLSKNLYELKTQGSLNPKRSPAVSLIPWRNRAQITFTLQFLSILELRSHSISNKLEIRYDLWVIVDQLTSQVDCDAANAKEKPGKENFSDQWMG